MHGDENADSSKAMNGDDLRQDKQSGMVVLNVVLICLVSLG